MKTRKVSGTITSTICTKKCWNAVTHICRCACAGNNHGVGEHNIMMVDAVPVLRNSNTQRQCCKAVVSFTFTDGNTVSACPIHSGRTNHYFTDFNSHMRIDVGRRDVLCGGAV